MKHRSYYTYINHKGERVFGKKFVDALPFSEGLAAVCVWMDDHLRWGFIDHSGEYVIEPKFHNVYGGFKAGLATVSTDKGYGYIDHSGKFVIEPQFYDARVFCEGIAAVSLDGFYGYIDYKGKFVIPPTFGFAGDFSEGLAAVILNGVWGYIDASGKMVIPTDFEDIGVFIDGYARVKIATPNGLITKRINHNGKIVDAVEFELPFSEDLKLTGEYGSYGYKNTKGQWEIEPSFKMGSRDFSEGLAAVEVYE